MRVALLTWLLPAVMPAAVAVPQVMHFHEGWQPAAAPPLVLAAAAAAVMILLALCLLGCLPLQRALRHLHC